ncbi:MAG: hypothetical protein AABZ31_04500, partial [Bdellovibrionota bacterium]
MTLILSVLTVYGIDTFADNGLLDKASKDLNAYIKANASSLDVSKLLSSRVVYFGETHSEPISKKFLISEMANHKKNVFTHMALEM